MIGSKILNLGYTLTNTSATTFLDGNTTNIYEHLNTFYGHRILDILRVRVDRNASIEEATTTLKSTVGLVEGDNGYNGEYAFPTDLLKPVRFEISYDGEEWRKARVYDNALNPGSEFNEVQLEADFDQWNPRVDFTRGSYKIRPPKTTAGDITKGVYIEYEKRQADFTDLTEPSEIEKNLQDILAYDLAELEFIMHPDSHSAIQIQLFREKKQEVEQRFLEFYKNNLKANKTVTYNYQLIE
jgi:hypothetical protein